ncbi:hypothetical protein [Halobaculum limi]|uniref:hypothetical protein n=1 Tax=Halobaculum limi TaxID=3031916 RepID=UPI0024076ABF|nr:hypothetical protein [Halobaculum sp. YSMS11]
MNRTKLLAIGLATLLAVTGVAAAQPGNAPADAGGNDDAQAGPPTDLPEQVPDFVSQIHDQIRSFIDGSVDNLGDAVSGIAGGENADSGDEQSADSDDAAA